MKIIPCLLCILGMLLCTYAIGADIGFGNVPPCSGDFEPDGDVDGADLVAYISNTAGISLANYAEDFGRNDCHEALPPAPLNQFTIGDSIGEGEAADGTIGEIHHETVWSTGYESGDVVYSLNEQFEDADPTGYYENNSVRDPVFNSAVSGSVMADFFTQANQVIASASNTPSGKAGMITILLGNNDVCAASLEDMTDPVLFDEQYRAGLDALAGSDVTKDAYIHVSSIPAIYWLWNAKRNNWWCRVIAWPFVPCENLLDNPADDCVSSDSRLDPDTIYEGDGENCIRRKQFHEKIRDIYNFKLRDVLQEYIDDGRLPNAYFVDIFDIQFGSDDINGGDCFHPSVDGHALLAEEHWWRSPWSMDDSLSMH